ncbi:hypothetical protein, conserved [Eimeria praecox]|uniref:SAM-dependent MTase RsmB/NOP-type domain-containing protein n=1 Tax=Eimeria praecox TaxID=51316 RepID=U6G2V2_9EIME|nr:hypothetical protein, conserved [Eimeria praecox]
MARGKRSFRGAELMGKRRAAKYQRAVTAEEENGKPQPTKGTYAEIIYENAAYEEYYKAQAICPKEEWDDFMAIQRLRLPAAVRVNVSAPLWRSTRSLLLEMSMEGGKNNVRHLQFFPHELAWQWDAASKVDMKKDDSYKEIRSQVINEDFRGSLTRQEAVSMLPCLFLDIQPHHLVLDMCSSPGSKTSEMLDMLQWNARLCESKERGGTVGISPVTASCFPTLYEGAGGGPQKDKLLFDRILADVPCSGDGTLRKNLDVWRSWNAGGGHSMHPIQLSILYRGLQLLHVNGRIVYSTCSLNPLEDEAVIATVLSQQKGRVEVVDPPELPGLRWSKGKSSWLVPSPPAKERTSVEDSSKTNSPAGDQATFFRTFDEVPEEFRHRIRPTMFPPLGAESLSLEKCVRVLPHHNNTGGFFVCCLRKIAELDASQIFISNKSKVRAAAEEKQHGRHNCQGKGGPRPAFKSPSSDAPDSSCRPEGIAADSKAIYPAEPERNPLLDGELLAEELDTSTNSHPEAASGSVKSVSEHAPTASPSSEEGSLYALAATVSKPGSLFHLLLPANCDAEGSRGLQMIFDFFGLDGRTPLLAGDLRDPGNVESLDASLLFRRVHSQKKIFLLSKRLADLVKICYGAPGARLRKELLVYSQSRRGELRQQVDGLLRSKIRWVHAGATVLVKHSETKTGEDQGLGAEGWRVPQEGAALMATFMRRRIVFVSLVVGRLLLLPEARVVRLSELLHFESRKQVFNLSSCRDKDGSIEAGGVVCIICPTSVVAIEDFVKADAHEERTSELKEEQRLLAQKYPIKNNPSFASISDSLCVACMLTKCGNLHAYMNKNEAMALAFHLFKMPGEELTTACNNK